MEKVQKFENIQEGEKKAREEDRAMLESLSGFARLSDKQKQYILTSLYIQQRAERGTDAVSADRIQETGKRFDNFPPKTPYISNPEKIDFESAEFQKNRKRYFSSQLKIMNDYCHKAIADLEEYKNGKSVSRDWHDAGNINSYEDLEQLVALSETNSKIPFVVQIWSGKPGEYGQYRWWSALVHTALILGRNKEGELMAWEKVGFHMPFRVVPLKQVYKEHPDCVGWQLRALDV